MIIYVLMLCSLATATAEFALIGLLPQIAAGLHVTVAAAGQLVTAYMLVVAAGGPAATILTRRLPRRGLLAGTMTLASGAAVLSALAGSYGVLLAARVGSALAQALLMALASQVAMTVAPAGRQTAAVARVFAGFALATVAGLPVGTLIGQACGWHATFILVAALSAAGLAGILAFCPPIPAAAGIGLSHGIRALANPSAVLGLLVTLLTLTGFVAMFTYVTPMLRSVSGFSPGWVSVALIGYGLGTIADSTLAGRVPPPAIGRLLPLPVAALALILLAQPVLLHYQPLALAGLISLGTATFTIVPLVQTWVMSRTGAGAAGLAASVNISAAGLAGALGAALGGAELSAGLGLAWIGPTAAIPVLAATATATRLSRRSAPAPASGIASARQK